MRRCRRPRYGRPSDDILTMAPPPRSTIFGAACLVHSHAPRRLIAMTRSKSSTVRLDERSEMNDAGIGDQFVDAAERPDAGLDHADDLFLVADVDLITDCTRTDLRAAASAAAPSMSAHSTLQPSAASRSRHRQADPGAGPGDDRGLTGQVWMRHRPPLACVASALISPRPPRLAVRCRARELPRTSPGQILACHRRV